MYKEIWMTIDSMQFRQVMRRFPTGVTLLTSRDDQRVHGMTANSFTSVSLDPTLVLVCVKKNSRTHVFVLRANRFALNILSEHQAYLAQRFAHQSVMPAEPFADVAFHADATGAPILDDCIAYVDCRLTAAHDAGDHTIFIGTVQAIGFGNARDAQPLIWLDGAYTSLSDSETLLLTSHVI